MSGMETPVVVHRVDGELYVWDGGRYVDVYTDARQWATGDTPLRSFEVRPTPFEPGALPELVQEHLDLRAAVTRGRSEGTRP